MILTVIDVRRRNKPLRSMFVRIQRLREGKIVVVNALFLLWDMLHTACTKWTANTRQNSVLFSAGTAVYLTACKIRIYQVIYQKVDSHNLIFLILCMPVFPFLSGVSASRTRKVHSDAGLYSAHTRSAIWLH